MQYCGLAYDYLNFKCYQFTWKIEKYREFTLIITDFVLTHIFLNSESPSSIK